MKKKSTITSHDLAKDLAVSPFRPIDRQFAQFLQRRFKADESAALAGAAALAVLESGHSCFSFDEQCVKPWGDEEGKTIQLPAADEWLAALAASPAVGKPGDRAPLILDGRQLYLYKYFSFEEKVAARLRSMSAIHDAVIPEAVTALAQDLFRGERDLSAFGGQLQTAGAMIPLFSRFSIITGGPGTGKTTVLARMLALLCANAREQGEAFPTILLAAPTGKAAQRMGESIAGAAASIPDVDIRLHLSKLTPSTIHRLLGLYGDSPKPKRDHQTPIEADIVVIDEASMMDITMFARIIDALPVDARLILLGDRNQLASVQAGCVMADICDALGSNQFSAAFTASVNAAIDEPRNYIKHTSAAAVLSPVIELQFSYRFEGIKPIGVISQAIREGKINDALTLLQSDQDADEYCRFSDQKDGETLAEYILQQYEPLIHAADPVAALALVKNFMVLTVVNEGPFGRIGINEQVYRSHGSIPPVRPIKITENSPAHDLYNGDIGVIVRKKNADGEDVERAWFTDTGEAPRQFLVGALPSFVDAFAITIHNSQGSEFEEVMIVLPVKNTDILTRELLYTGVTRAKKRTGIYGSAEIVTAAIGRPTDRHSGLAGRL